MSNELQSALNQNTSPLVLGIHTKNLEGRAPVASVGFAPKPTLTPEEAVKFIGSRSVDESLIYKPAAQPRDIARPDSIAELARALKNDPDLIFQWVYNNVEYVPTFGEAKGGLNCLIDGYGNAFDQCELLFALLTQAGFTPNYVLGQIQINATQAAAWLGTDATNLNYAFNIFNNGGIPVQFINSNTQLKLTHIWIKVAISGTTYVFDPSIKTYSSKTGINIGTAMGYSQATLLSQATTGATVDPGGLFIQSVNSANLEAQLTTYATTLQNYIQTNNPTAELADIIGGRAIVPIVAPVRLTAQPYEVPGDVPTIWTAIPNSYRITVNVQVNTINQTFFGSDIHGQRFSLWVDSSVSNPDLRRLILNGTEIANYPNPGSTVGDTLTYTVTYPYASTFANASIQEAIFASGFDHNFNDHTWQYLLSFAFGPVGPGRVDYWQDQVQINQAANTDTRSEVNMGSTLGLLWNTRASSFTAVQDMLGKLSQTINIWHHQIGTTYWTGSSLSTQVQGSYAFNLNGVTILTEALNANSNAAACALALGIHDGCTERASLQGVVGVPACASPASFIDAANNTNTKLYKVTPANQSTTLPLLTGYQSDATSAYTQQVGAGYSLLIPQTAPEAIQGGTGSQIQGAGWIPFNLQNMFGYIVDTVITKGGLSPICSPFVGPLKKKDHCDCEGEDPVDERTGDYRYENSDLSVGSSEFPYALEFKSMYDSRLRLRQDILGLGWTHNWNYSAGLTSEPLRALGSESPIEAALSITEFYVSLDLNSDTTQPVTKLAVMFISGNWWAGQLTNNAINFSFPDGNRTFVTLPDGTYHPEQNDNGSYIQTGSGFAYVSPQQDQKFIAVPTNPRSAPNLMNSWVFPNGVTLNLTYNNTAPFGIATVTNNLGRTLTFGYTGSFLSSVTDGNSRTVNYSVNTSTNLLTSISDPLTNVTTFGYDSANRLYKYFKPQNPTNPVVTNSYDTLNRVSSQLDIYGHMTTFYFAGSRSEFVDPAGHSQVQYYDAHTNLIREVDELGNITSYSRDGRGRPSVLTYPEGNSETYTYDSKDNVLSVTYKAKPGSPLVNIVNSSTYDPTYNKVHTSVDGKMQTTTYNYDPATGNLLNVQKPMVAGATPTLVYTYNTRGQILTATDESGVLTKYTYSTTNETRLTQVVDSGVSPHLNLTTTFTYDTAGNIKTVKDALNSVTTFAFDKARRLMSRTEATPFSYITNYGYDKNNNLSSIQRQTGVAMTPFQTYTIAYTLSDKVKTVTDPAMNVTTKTYDNFDRLWTVQDAELRTTTFVYDQRSKLFTVKDSSGTISETRTYTNNGKLYQLTDARSKTTTYSYDGFDRSDKTTYADVSFEENTSYDANNNVLTQLTRSGASITNTVDPLNRLSTKAPQGQATVTYVYDLSGRLLSATTPVVSGNPATGGFSFSYDTAGRLTQEKTPDNKTVKYGLDKNGNLTKLTYPDSYFVTRVYDALNRLTDIKLNGATTSAINITYDQLSRRALMTYGNGATSTYTFQLNDDLTTLAEAFSGSSVTLTYGFNKVHQENSRGVTDGTYLWHPGAGGTTTFATANSVNEYPTVGGASFQYDGNGNLKSDGTWTYVYDTENHLLSANKTGVSASYVYDGFHRQIQKTVGSTKSRYYYGGWQRLADYDGTALTLQNRYVYGTELDEPLVEVSSSGTITYLHTDRLGSIIATSNSAGAVTSTASYGPSGESVPPNGINFGFTGQRFDSETGLYYFKRRYYSATVGRFLQPDPVGYTEVPQIDDCGCGCSVSNPEPTDLNLYTYAENDPLNHSDPLGLAPNLIQYEICIGIAYAAYQLANDKLKKKKCDEATKKKEQEEIDKKYQSDRDKCNNLYGTTVNKQPVPGTRAPNNPPYPPSGGGGMILF